MHCVSESGGESFGAGSSSYPDADCDKIRNCKDIQKPHYIGHRSRVKNKFLTTGFSGWNDYEILEFALFFALPRGDTKEIAKNLIKKFGSLKQVIDACAQDLALTKGVSKDHCAVFINFLKSFSSLYHKLKIKEAASLSSPSQTVDYLSSLLSGEKEEKFHMILLDSANKVIDCLELSSGTVNKSVVFPRQAAAAALNCKAASAIIAHNHPGGTLSPSKNDVEATKAVKEALKAVEAELIDHIIIAGNSYFSFREYNLL
jgi:DNA repair protein RadC